MKNTVDRHCLSATCLALSALMGACATTPIAGSRSVTIRRTTFGIAHVTAPDWEGIAYAHAQDNVCQTAEHLLTLRGERSPLLGPQAMGDLGLGKVANTQIDLFIRFHIPERALCPKLDAHGTGTERHRTRSNKNLAGMLVMDDLLKACTDAGTALVADQEIGCRTLAAWDRTSNAESHGALLFREFWRAAKDIPKVWRVPFDALAALAVPSGRRGGAARRAAPSACLLIRQHWSAFRVGVERTLHLHCSVC